MAFNLSPLGNSKRVSLGTGVLRVKAWSAASSTTPTSADDVGYGRGGQLTLTRQKQELLLGLPRQLIAQYAVQEDISLSFQGVEWNIDRITQTLGAGVQSGTANDQIMVFGGDMLFQDLSLSFVHNTPNGGTVTVDFWKCQGQGEFQVSWGDEFHEVPFTFRALNAVSVFGGDPVNAKGSLMRMRVQIA